jgi:hypothetical protein
MLKTLESVKFPDLWLASVHLFSGVLPRCRSLLAAMEMEEVELLLDWLKPQRLLVDVSRDLDCFTEVGN